MHIYGPSQLHRPQSIGSSHGVGESQATSRPQAAQITDEVDISEAAQMAEQIQQMPEDRIAAVRQQIAEGTYETNERLNAAVERLLDEIG